MLLTRLCLIKIKLIKLKLKWPAALQLTAWPLYRYMQLFFYVLKLCGFYRALMSFHFWMNCFFKNSVCFWLVLFSKNKVIPVPLFILWCYWRTENPLLKHEQESIRWQEQIGTTSARSQHLETPLHSALQCGGLLLQHDDVLPSQCDCISIISVSHRFIEAWCWARKSQRHGCDVAFIHQHLHCSYSPPECHFFSLRLLQLQLLWCHRITLKYLMLFLCRIWLNTDVQYSRLGIVQSGFHF